MYVNENRKITNKECLTLYNVSNEGDPTGLNELIEKNIFIAKGSGRSAHYTLK